MSQQFNNNPQMNNEYREGMVKRHSHQPLSIDHYGIHCKIRENGKVVITAVAKQEGDMIEYDEVEIPASLVFKLANLLKNTRVTTYVPIGTAMPEVK